MSRLTVLVDFHGVLHSHHSGNQSDRIMMSDPPVPGAIAWLDAIASEFTVAVACGRFMPRPEAGPTPDMAARGAARQAKIDVKLWLRKHGLQAPVTLDPDWSGAVVVTQHKCRAVAVIDDRAIPFAGTFPTADQIRATTPWHLAT